MREYTQTDTTHGNCWQTAIACVLEVDPAELPCQVSIEVGKRSYNNALLWYLEKHHGLMYSELQDYQFPALDVRQPGWHVALGPTVRTAVHGKHHAVVAHRGTPVWDPHPTRAGLLEVQRWGILAPLPGRIAAEREARRAKYPGEWGCECPACLKRT